MNNNPKVSIITVVLNGEKTIEQTILSVINQTYKNIEYIIIDGDSSDGTMDIVQKYSKYISLIISERDAGLYDAMNKGINHATGDIIGIINSDDWYEQDAVEKIVQKMMLEDAELIHGDVRRIKEDGKSYISKPSNLREIVIYMPIYHPTVFIKRNIYTMKGGFDTQYEIAADYELLLRLYYKNVEYTYIPEVIANFRENGISEKRWFECKNEALRIAYKYADQSGKREEVLTHLREQYKWNIFLKNILEKNNLLENLVNKFFNVKFKEIVIWGAGIWGKHCSTALNKSNMNIVKIIDNCQEKWNMLQNGIKINGPENIHEKDYVLIAVKENSEIIKEQAIKKISGTQIVTISELVDFWEKNYFNGELEDIIIVGENE